MARRILSVILAFLTAAFGNIRAFFIDMVNDYTFEVNAAVLGDRLPNVKNNINRFGGRFNENPIIVAIASILLCACFIQTVMTRRCSCCIV